MRLGAAEASSDRRGQSLSERKYCLDLLTRRSEPTHTHFLRFIHATSLLISGTSDERARISAGLGACRIRSRIPV